MRKVFRILVLVLLLVVLLLATSAASAHDKVVWVGSHHHGWRPPVPAGMPYIHHHGHHYHVGVSRAAVHAVPGAYGWYLPPAVRYPATPRVTVTITIGR